MAGPAPGLPVTGQGGRSCVLVFFIVHKAREGSERDYLSLWGNTAATAGICCLSQFLFQSFCCYSHFIPSRTAGNDGSGKKTWPVPCSFLVQQVQCSFVSTGWAESPSMPRERLQAAPSMTTWDFCISYLLEGCQAEFNCLWWNLSLWLDRTLNAFELLNCHGTAWSGTVVFNLQTDNERYFITQS